jgi:mono/diheme cytochrome c family protein
MAPRRGASAVLAAAMCLSAMLGCSDELGSNSGRTLDSGSEGDAHDDAEDEDPVRTPVERGQYLVDHVAVCAECHTPRLLDGRLDPERKLAGVINAFDVLPDDDSFGLLHTPNLTPDRETGLGQWTDLEIKVAFLNGISRDGRPLHPVMPYAVFYNMIPEHADAIVAYLRSVPAVNNLIPEPQPLPVALAAPAPPVPEDVIPDTTLAPTDPNYERARRGRYLAAQVGLCMYCHTEEAALGDGPPLRTDKLFMGRRKVDVTALGVLPPAVRPVAETWNLTPHENGLYGWTPDAVRRVVKEGQDILGLGVCAPMPVGPGGGFAGMTDHDALAIGHYLTTLQPRDNGVIERCCGACHKNDGGAIGTGH